MGLKYKLNSSDLTAIEKYMKHEDVAKLYLPDVEVEVWSLDYDKFRLWTGFYVNNMLKGAILIEQRSNAYLMFHPYMHFEDRKYKFQMITTFETWVKKMGNIGKLVVEFPVYFENLIKFALACGYTEQGVNTKAYRMGGKFYDLVQYGKEVQ